MINRKSITALLAAPLFLIACGDESSSSADIDYTQSCSFEYKYIDEDNQTQSENFCIETLINEDTKKIMDSYCQDRFARYFEGKAKYVNSCPIGKKQKCTEKDKNGNEIFYYFYNDDNDECDEIINAIHFLTGMYDFDSSEIISSFESADTSKIDLSKMSDNEKEFESIYERLNFHYFYAHTDSLIPEGTPWYKQLSSRSSYKGAGKGNIPEKFKNDNLPSELEDAVFMVRSLNDHYTDYTPPQHQNYDDFIDEFEDREVEYAIGFTPKKFVISEDSTIFVIQQVFAGSAESEAGIQKNDTIVSIMDEKLTNKSDLGEIFYNIEGEEYDIVVSRNQNGKRIEKKFTIKIHDYNSPSVVYNYDDSISYIQIVDFASNNTYAQGGTYEEFVNALNETKHTKATIIDLRDNLGGDAVQCEAIASTMVHKNDTVAIKMYGKHDLKSDKPIWTEKAFIAQEDGLASDRYFVFLANNLTGSCAEYTLMGVTNAQNAPIVGKTTYGKGTGFAFERTYLNGTLTYTMEFIMDNHRETYHTRGIVPDIEEDNPDKQVEIALKIAQEKTMKRTKKYGEKATSNYNGKAFAKKNDISSKPTRADYGMYRKFNSKEEFEEYINQ